MNLILLGAPGSGKGTQAEFLITSFQLTHVATGDLFRYNLKERTKLGLIAEEYMNKGQLVPDDVTIAMVRERLQQPDVQQGVLFDGFPRTLAQAEALTQLLNEMGKSVDCVIYLRVSDDEIVERLSGRLICTECQQPFHKKYNPFKECPYHKCHGEYLVQREDDKPETVRARLETFHKQTAPLIEYYKQHKLLEEVNGEGNIEDIKQTVYQEVLKKTEKSK